MQRIDRELGARMRITVMLCRRMGAVEKVDLTSKGAERLGEFDGGKPNSEEIKTELNGEIGVIGEKSDALLENRGDKLDLEEKNDLNSNGRERLDEFEDEKLDKQVTETELNGDIGPEGEKSEVYSDNQPVEEKESETPNLVAEDSSGTGSGIVAGEEAALTEESYDDKVGVDSSSKGDADAEEAEEAREMQMQRRRRKRGRCRCRGGVGEGKGVNSR